MASNNPGGVELETTVTTLNQMRDEKVIGEYAIGGAVAAIFYIEPFTTFDLDVFFITPNPSEGLISLTEIYEYLRAHGYQAEAEAVRIGSWPVQFLPAYNPLVEEAVTAAREVILGQTLTRVMRAEHLVAIMLQTGRLKDYARIGEFLRQKVVDLDELRGVLSRHGLLDKWEEFRSRFGI
ncbi:MAG TPA: hypothetical protein VNO70_21660 [Blastocatellia bacterium]|nr:hypothetical protein [Blastocatellia bacterium]